MTPPGYPCARARRLRLAVRGARAPRATRWSGRPSATRRSSTTSWSASADLPVGWTDEQDGGHYRLRRRDDEALFGYDVGPHSWKRYQLPPEVRLWRARARPDGALAELAEDAAAPPPALRVPRRALLRAARDGRSSTACCSAARTPTPATGRAARGRRSSSRSSAGRPAAPASASRWAPGPTAERGLRPRAHRGARGRRATTSCSRSAASAGAEVLAELPARAPAGAPSARRRERRARARGRADGPRARHRPTSASCSTATTSTRAGRRSPSAACRAATARWSARPASARPSRTSTDLAGEARRAPPALGLVLHRSTTPTSTAARCAARRARATASG